jgi:hypothetical protein
MAATDPAASPGRPCSPRGQRESRRAAARRERGLRRGIAALHAFTPTAALAFGFDGVGSTGAAVGFDRYRAFVRLRRDLLRRWIFFEVEPEVAWPWTPEHGRTQVYAVTFRLELQLEAAGAAEAVARREVPAAGPLNPP